MMGKKEKPSKTKNNSKSSTPTDLVLKKIEEVNKILLDGEPGNIKELNYPKRTYYHYDVGFVRAAMRQVFGVFGWDEDVSCDNGVVMHRVGLYIDTKAWTKGSFTTFEDYGYKHRIILLNTLSLFGIGVRAFEGGLEDDNKKSKVNVKKKTCPEPTEALPRPEEARSYVETLDKLKDASPAYYKELEGWLWKSHGCAIGDKITADIAEEVLSRANALLLDASPDFLKKQVVDLFSSLSSNDQAKFKLSINKRYDKELSELDKDELKEVKEVINRFINKGKLNK